MPFNNTQQASDSPSMDEHANATPDTEEMVPLSSRPGYLIRRLNQIHVAIFATECEAYNVTPIQYGALSTLLAQPGLDQKTLGFEIGLDRTNTADVLKRLEGRRLIERKRSSRDQRVKQAFLTDEGKNITQAMYAGMIKAQRRLIAPLSEAEQEQFLQNLHTLVNGNNSFARASMRVL